ncbi:MAG: hypothetical protein IKH78_00585 [Ruminococcus sp.]|nr:hypothetical protein [Ruminococcus sp.]
MNSRKNIAGISALTVLLSYGTLTAMNAFAEEAADFTTGKLTAHLYSDEKLRDVECRYYSDMPSVPYMKLSDYYSCWLDQELEIANRNDGTYEVRVPIGTTGTIDVNKDTVSSDDAVSFLYPEYVIKSSDSNIYTYVKGKESQDSEKISATIDLSEYRIDLRGDSDDIWWPVPTLCDFYEFSLNQGALIDDELYFFPHILADYSRTNLAAAGDHIAAFTEKYQNGRPKDLAEYNYNELCFVFDKDYGFPGRFAYNDLLSETNFDTMLSTASDGTKKIKEMLLSEDVYEYCAGYELLNCYFWDGGHTFFTDIMLQPETEFTEKVAEKIRSAGLPEDAFDYSAIINSSNSSGFAAFTARGEMYKTADTLEELNSSVYSTKGDTAVFSFNSFTDDSNSWLNYYYNNGEMPQDIISEFYYCVAKADADPAIKNFVIDLGTNSGGSLSVVEYMMGLINGLDNVTVVTDNEKGPEKARYSVDKNLDKAYDEKDEAIKPALSFGIITTKYSFSCGNLMPSLAKDAGIMLIGERSGGGTCATNRYITPDGMLYTLSTGLKFVDKDGNTIDNGIEPDYEIVKVNGDGSKDFSELYNYSRLSALFSEFYSNKTESDPPAATTAPAAATTKTTTH